MKLKKTYLNINYIPTLSRNESRVSLHERVRAVLNRSSELNEITRQRSPSPSLYRRSPERSHTRTPPSLSPQRSRSRRQPPPLSPTGQSGPLSPTRLSPSNYRSRERATSPTRDHTRASRSSRSPGWRSPSPSSARRRTSRHSNSPVRNRSSRSPSHRSRYENEDTYRFDIFERKYLNIRYLFCM